MVSRFDVVLMSLDPVVGREMKKTRPCVIISPDDINHSKNWTVIVAPLTSNKLVSLPTHIPVVFNNKKGKIVLEQLRAVDRARIIKKLGTIGIPAQTKVLQCLARMFEE